MYTFTDSQKHYLLNWARELETTDLPQTQGYLHKGAGFCCLGILCQMQDPTLWHKPSSSAVSAVFVYQLDGVHTDLPQKVRHSPGTRSALLGGGDVAKNIHATQ